MERDVIADLEVTYLTDEEREQVVAALRADAEKYSELLQKVIITAESGRQFDGAQFFGMVNNLENQVLEWPLERNLKTIEAIIDRIDTLIDAVPKYYQLYYLKGRIWLLALIPRENYIISKREIIDSDPELILIKKQIFDTYGVIEDCHIKALELIESIIKEQSSIPVSAYLTVMKGSLATLFRRHAAFLARSAVRTVRIDEQTMEKIYQLSMRSHLIFGQMFKEDIFIDRYTVGISLANWANALKIVPGPKELPLRYYEAARKICGDDPSIMEGIAYCQELVARQKAQ
ncbi:hypothetical protein TRIP_C90034 [Candidatus Zixiibacteriota bacterium]|nr:hypothetical protein TRIP_C90034 [candidate division Zixibacteria bacterium]